jgi:hypothetical protein
MSDRKLTPSGWYYVLAGLVAVAGIAGFAMLLIDGISAISSGSTQVVVPGKQALTLTETGDYTVFHEYRCVIDGTVYSGHAGDASGIECRLTRTSDGQDIKLSPASMHSTYTIGSRAGVSLFEFNIDAPGEYTFEANYPAGRFGPKTVMAIGQGFVGRLLVTILGGLGILFGSLGLAITIVIVTAIKRRRSATRSPEIIEDSVYRVPPVQH